MGLRIHISESDARAIQAACIDTGLIEHNYDDPAEFTGGHMKGKNLHGEAFALLFNKISNALDARHPSPKAK